MNLIDELAGMYTDLVAPPGIPWDGLTASGHGLTENGYDPAYMDYMLRQGQTFFSVLGSLNQDFRDKYRGLRATEAKAAVTQMMALVNQTAADVWQAMKVGDFDKATAFPRSVSVDALAAICAHAMNGAYLHYDGVVESAMRAGKLKPEEVEAHAQTIVQTFQTIVDLNANGHLDQFKETAPPGVPLVGIGGPELVIGWGIVALGVVLIFGICFLFFLFKIRAPLQQKIIEWCDQQAKTGNEDDIRACIQSAENMQKNGNGGLADFMGGALEPLAAVAGVGLVLYIGSLVIPAMIAKKVAS